MIRKLIKAIKKPSEAIVYIMKYKIFNILPDETYLKIKYLLKLQKKLNLKNPQSFNEKIQWLKLNDRNPEYIKLVDKYEVRQFIKNTIGEEYLIPLIGIWDSFDEINFEKLPNQFVLKCTHDSGGVIICKDKNTFDIGLAKKKMNRYLKKNYYWECREWPYKHIKPRIIAEKYMVDEYGIELKDYKFFCFNSKVKALFVATDRGIDTRFDFFDLDFNHIPVMQHYKNSASKIIKPRGFDKMIELSSILSKKIPHVRVDFYDINGNVYFGELTFYHFSGFEKFEPEKYDEIFGSWIITPISNSNNK